MKNWFKIDEEDLEIIKPYKWFNNGKYAIGHHYINGKRTTLYMQKLIIHCPVGMEIDHINGNGLDNRKANLRICTRRQNSMNQHKVNPTTGFKGVYCKDPRKNRRSYFYAGLETNRKAIHLGIYKTAKEVAKAYNEGAKKYFKDFACLNIL